MTLALAVLLLAPADTLAPCVDGQTWSRADLAATGVGRLADLVRLIDEVDAVSVNGFDSEIGTPLRPVRVLVDGFAFAGTATIEPSGLEALPIAIGEIEAVTFCPEPTIAAGAFSGATLSIRTAPPAPRAYAAVDYGNETGDPGPLRYLEPDRPNIDHEGPDAEAALVHQARTTAVWTALRSRRFFPTDTAIVGRIQDAIAPGRFPSRTALAWGARARTRGPGGHAVRAGVVDARDLPYVPALGRELPVRRRTAHLGVSGRLARVGGARLGYRAEGAYRALRRPAWGALPVDPDWREGSAVGAVEVEGQGLDRDLRGGVQAEVRRASGPGLGAGSASLGRLWAQTERRRGRARETITAAIATTGRETAASGAAVTVRPLGSGVEGAVVLSGTRSLAAEAPDLAFWTARGYAGLDLDGGALVRERRSTGASEDRIRVSLRARLAPGVEGGVWGDARRQRAEVAVATRTLAAVTSRLAVAAGEALRSEAWVSASRRAVRVRAFARVGGVVRGTAALREVGRREPRVRGALEITARPDPNLGLRARLEGRSATVWAGFPDPEVPAHVRLDLSLDKAVWERRLVVSIAGRNVLGAPERTHPLGATLAARLHVRLTGRF